MNLAALVLYGVINGCMVLSCLLGERGRIYEFPFWFGALGLGYFFPMAIAQFSNENYPEHAYGAGMLFAALCSLALWNGFHLAHRKTPHRGSWLDVSFDSEKLVAVGIALSVMGFYFQLKLSSLPEEMLAQTVWTGATVKYHFLASIFKVGFLILWIVYLGQSKRIVPKIFIFMIPGFLMLFERAVVAGRRGVMMELAAYIFIGLWFTRRKALPRGLMIVCLSMGLVFVGAIGTYRGIMRNRNMPLAERLMELYEADLVGASKENAKESAHDFSNYIYYRHVIAEDGKFNLGATHWNRTVQSYVPSQVVGGGVKKSLMLEIDSMNVVKVAKDRYGHKYHPTTVSTGYKDAFGSFGWLGVIKFWLIGWIMGILYRHAMADHFLAQLLYAYVFSSGLHAISHGTQQILVDKWIYFFGLAFPVLFFAKLNKFSSEAPASNNAGLD